MASGKVMNSMKILPVFFLTRSQWKIVQETIDNVIEGKIRHFGLFIMHSIVYSCISSSFLVAAKKCVATVVSLSYSLLREN